MQILLKNIFFISTVLSVFLICLITFSNLDFGTNIQSKYYGKLFGYDNHRRHVFIDLGANIGDSIKYFIDKNSATEGIKGYAARDESIKWEIYAVEANPYFNKHLDELKGYCERLGHTIYLHKETAAWIRNEKLTFYLDTVNPQHNYWGSSLLSDHNDVKKSNYKNVTVNGIDVSELLSKYSDNDEIILKIDIEGTEYELLEHLVKKDTLRLVDIIAIEFHNHFLNKKEFSEIEAFIMKYFKIFDIKFIKWF